MVDSRIVDPGVLDLVVGGEVAGLGLDVGSMVEVNR